MTAATCMSAHAVSGRATLVRSNIWFDAGYEPRLWLFRMGDQIIVTDDSDDTWSPDYLRAVSPGDSTRNIIDAWRLYRHNIRAERKKAPAEKQEAALKRALAKKNRVARKKASAEKQGEK